MLDQTDVQTAPGSVGLVQTQYFTFPGPLRLTSGKELGPITLAYETYGELNSDRSNAILVEHALSGDAHVAGRHHPADRKPGWWDMMVGPGKALDTTKYFVICANCIGGCMGSTGPSSINPATGRPYGMSFPVITIEDMVEAETYLLDHLGIERVLCVIGGSMGGMRTLQWAVSHPDRVRLAIPIATTSRHTAQAIAFDEVGRQAIMADPNWKGGDYYGGPRPERGLAIARMIGHITYLSDEAMHRKFGRNLIRENGLEFGFEEEFQVQSYLRYQGDSFVQRFDANSYLYITKAMDYFDLTRPSGSLKKELSRAKAKFLVISFTSDWLYPTYQSREIVTALRQNNAYVTFAEITTPHGHDAFLLESRQLTSLISNFLSYAVD
jgi:homoserine O-acetyltransferase